MILEKAKFWIAEISLWQTLVCKLVRQFSFRSRQKQSMVAAICTSETP